MRRFASWEVAATAVRRVARRAVRPRIAKVMVEVVVFALGLLANPLPLWSVRGEFVYLT